MKPHTNSPSNPEKDTSDEFVNLNPGNDDFWNMLQSSPTPIEEGEIIKGKVVAIDNDGVLVDIGFKSEGMVPLLQFKKNEQGKLDVNVGDEIEVYVVKKETDTGLVALSKRLADRMRGWSTLSEAYQEQRTISGVGVTANRAGLIVDLGGNITGFLPVSQLGLNPGEKPDSLIRKKVWVKILDLDIPNGRVILSRRAALDEERSQKKTIAFQNIREGDILKGKVKAIAPYGAFIDLGDIDGLLHISDMSWSPIKNPNELVKLGDEIEVIVLRRDEQAGQVSLGLKQKTPDPWSLVEKKYPVGSTVPGKVVALMDYGAFIRLEEGIEGMVHISEMSWTQRVNHPSEIVKIGDEIQVEVLGIVSGTRRIALGIKQTLANPWSGIEEQYPVGSVVHGKIIAVTEYGAFVQLEEGIEGLVHISDFSWMKPIKHPSEMVQVGDMIEVRVLKVNQGEKKIGLGIKQLSSDPWLNFIRKHPLGDTVTGKIVSITDFGAFVELEDGIEGLCRLSQLDIKRIKTPDEAVKVGQETKFKLLRLNKTQKRAVLSRRAFLEEQEKKEFESYKANEPEVKTNLGELLNPDSK
ncbi:MAG: 30S ribosomal protein S1 [bacterium]|nr:30S ribosomal protein S1 [bacterium]